MFAQAITEGTAPEQHTGIDHIQRDELASALQQEPGFSGALSLLDRESGTRHADRALGHSGAGRACPLAA